VGGVALDAVGDLFISDQLNNVVAEVTPSGTLTIAAGTGVADVTGDGGPAVNAAVTSPGQLAFDPSGNLYIADPNNGLVRKVTPAGVISTVAGVPLSTGNCSTQVEGSAGTSFCVSPNGLTSDAAGNIYISDGENYVRKLRTDGTIITVVGNNRSGGYSGDGGPAIDAALNLPEGIAVDGAGNLFIADLVNSRIREVTTDGIIHTFAGDGSVVESGDGEPATSAGLGAGLQSVATYGGNVYIGNSGDVRVVGPGGIISTLAPTNGGPTFNEVSSLAVNTSGVYAGDQYNSRVQNIDFSGSASTTAGDGLPNFFGDGGPATSAGIDLTQYNGGVWVDSAGVIYIADTNSERIRNVTTDGIIHTLAGNGTAGFSGDDSPAIDAELNRPLDVTTDQAGNVYIADANNVRIRKVDTNGVITTFAGNGFAGFGDNSNSDIGDGGLATNATLGANLSGVAVDMEGNVYIADGQNNRVREVSNGIITTVAGNGMLGNYGDGDGGPATSAPLNATGVAVDTDGSLYINDIAHHCVRKVDPQGIIHTVAGNGNPGGTVLDYPPGTLAVDVATESPGIVAPFGGGGFYVVGSESQVKQVNPDGTISILVRGFNFNGFATFGGDGGPAIDGLLGVGLLGLARDSVGDLYITDSVNERIRKVWMNGLPTATATPTP